MHQRSATKQGLSSELGGNGGIIRTVKEEFRFTLQQILPVAWREREREKEGKLDDGWPESAEDYVTLVLYTENVRSTF